MTERNKLDFLVKTAAVAALYAVLTIASSPMSYGVTQFRVSELLTLLAFKDKRFIPGLVLGCFLANLLSPAGWMDMVFGPLATLIAVYLVSRTKSLLIATLWPAIINGLIIGIMLYYVAGFPLAYAIFGVALGEFVVVTLAGYPIYRYLLNREDGLLEHISFK
ncbi:QueT transporter family protein [Alloiococcus sp. CFN-8]|uniref:QueT transporter family protein n=1 Tax=Alloiococcus sp. CFN-8 TaxID=3416081 RepID=UPI003CF409C8